MAGNSMQLLASAHPWPHVLVQLLQPLASLLPSWTPVHALIQVSWSSSFPPKVRHDLRRKGKGLHSPPTGAQGRDCVILNIHSFSTALASLLLCVTCCDYSVKFSPWRLGQQAPSSPVCSRFLGDGWRFMVNSRPFGTGFGSCRVCCESA